jgi:hypothetical protein
MRYFLKASGIAAAVAFAAFAPGAVAQKITCTLTCQAVRGSAPEPLGDREDHSIQIDEVSCRVDSTHGGRPRPGRILLARPP